MRFNAVRAAEGSTMVRRILIALTSGVVIAALSGCVVKETKPIAKINPVQAQKQIPADELLDVAIRTFDTGVPKDIAKDDEALAKKRIYPEIREGESRYMATTLRSTLEQSGQWGAVRVVPMNAEFVDVLVSGKILESTGAKLALEVSVKDSTGRQWFTNKRYESAADLGSYKTDASLKARDPFQNVYSQIANDMVMYREKLVADDRRDIRRVTELRFAQDLAPSAMNGYLAKDQKGLIKVARLPADNDPISGRIDKIRERDAGVVDTVNGYYANFADQMQESYGNWRRTSFDEIEKEERLRNQARTRTFLGAAAVLASVFVPGQCRSTDYNCRRIENAARTAGVIGGTASVLSGLKKYSDARVQAQALKELSQSFQSEVAPQVVDVEGRTLRLTGTAEEQYREWRELLQQFYNEENGIATASTLPAGVVPATSDADAAAGAGTAAVGKPPVAPPSSAKAATNASGSTAAKPSSSAAPTATSSSKATSGSAQPAATPAPASAPKATSSSTPASTTTPASPNKLAPSSSGAATTPSSKLAPATAPANTQAAPASGTVPAPKAASGVEAIPAPKVAPATSAPTTSLYRYSVRPAA